GDSGNRKNLRIENRLASSNRPPLGNEGAVPGVEDIENLRAEVERHRVGWVESHRIVDANEKILPAEGLGTAVRALATQVPGEEVVGLRRRQPHLERHDGLLLRRCRSRRKSLRVA